MRLMRATGPWLQTYRVLPGARGVMLVTGDHDIALSAGAFGCAAIVGWRFRARVFRERKLVLGRES